MGMSYFKDKRRKKNIPEQKEGQCRATYCDNDHLGVFPYCWDCSTDPMRREYQEADTNERD